MRNDGENEGKRINEASRFVSRDFASRGIRAISHEGANEIAMPDDV